MDGSLVRLQKTKLATIKEHFSSVARGRHGLFPLHPEAILVQV